MRKKFEVKPCPRCGGAGVIEYVCMVGWRVRCENRKCTCSAFGTENRLEGSSPLSAVRNWNSMPRQETVDEN
ncbi:MAG: hypothetical protein IJG38_02165 [Thermoguttaceae bacterium]|nr:hypothetical protein [Thermoguttaceae bacterium]